MSDEDLEKFITDSPGHQNFRSANFEYQRRQGAKAQKLTTFAILFAVMGVVVGLVFGIIQCRTNKSVTTPDNPPAQRSPSATAQPQQFP